MNRSRDILIGFGFCVASFVLLASFITAAAGGGRTIREPGRRARNVQTGHGGATFARPGLDVRRGPVRGTNLVATRRGVRPLKTTRAAHAYQVTVSGIGGGSVRVLAHDAIDAVAVALKQHRESLVTFDGELIVTVEHRKADAGTVYIGRKRGR